jgi:hypothetical protein
VLRMINHPSFYRNLQQSPLNIYLPETNNPDNYPSQTYLLRILNSATGNGSTAALDALYEKCQEIEDDLKKMEPSHLPSLACNVPEKLFRTHKSKKLSAPARAMKETECFTKLFETKDVDGLMKLKTTNISVEFKVIGLTYKEGGIFIEASFTKKIKRTPLTTLVPLLPSAKNAGFTDKELRQISDTTLESQQIMKAIVPFYMLYDGTEKVPQQDVVIITRTTNKKPSITQVVETLFPTEPSKMQGALNKNLMELARELLSHSEDEEEKEGFGEGEKMAVVDGANLQTAEHHAATSLNKLHKPAKVRDQILPGPVTRKSARAKAEGHVKSGTDAKHTGGTH